MVICSIYSTTDEFFSFRHWCCCKEEKGQKGDQLQTLSKIDACPGCHLSGGHPDHISFAHHASGSRTPPGSPFFSFSVHSPFLFCQDNSCNSLMTTQVISGRDDRPDCCRHEIGATMSSHRRLPDMKVDATVCQQQYFWFPLSKHITSLQHL